MQSAHKTQLITSGDKRVASLCKDLHEIVSQVSACKIQSHNGMRQGIALIDRHIVCDTIPRIQNYPWKEKEKEKVVIFHWNRLYILHILSWNMQQQDVHMMIILLFL